MNFNVKISSKISESEWNDDLAKSNASTIYQTYNWRKLYHEAFGSKPVFITITNDAGNVVRVPRHLIDDRQGQATRASTAAGRTDSNSRGTESSRPWSSAGANREPAHKIRSGKWLASGMHFG